MDPSSIGDVIDAEVADLHGTALRAWLHRIRFKQVEHTPRSVFRLKLDDRSEDMRSGALMRLSEEARIHSRPREAGLLQDRGRLFLVEIDEQVWGDGRHESVEVYGRYTRLNWVRLGSRCIRVGEETLLERDGLGSRY